MRLRLGRPWHAPPHSTEEGRRDYLLTGCCFEHKPILHSTARREEWAGKLQACIEKAGGEIKAWTVLPNHWHVLCNVSLPTFQPLLARLNNGTSTQFNREDGATGRQVWYRFSDRRIRGQGHYFGTINYLHANAVKHGYAEKADDWPHSSFHEYLETFGRDLLRVLWHAHPVDEYGRGWDDW